MTSEQVRRERVKRGWTQSKLAKVAGCSQPTIAHVEGGRRASRLVLAKIARALGIRYPDEVAGEAVAPPPPPKYRFPGSAFEGAQQGLTVREWQHSPISGDGFVLVSPSRQSALLGAFDVEGHGTVALPALHHLRGWLRGFARSLSIGPQIGLLAGELGEEMQRVGVSASFLLASVISAHDEGGRSTTFEAVTNGFPQPLLITYGPPNSTLEGAGDAQMPGAQPIRHERVVLPWRLVVATDGLLRRLGAGDEEAGRRQLLGWQMGPDRNQPLVQRLGNSLPSLDDESLWMVHYQPPWNHEAHFPIRDARSRHAALKSIREEARRRLGDGCDSLIQAIAEAMSNVHKYAYEGGDGTVTVRLRDEGNAIRVEVQDYGLEGRAREISAIRTHSGVGIMQRKVTAVEFVNAEPRGLIVNLRAEAPSP